MRCLASLACTLVFSLALGAVRPDSVSAQPQRAAGKAEPAVTLLAIQGEVRTSRDAAPRVFVPGETLHSGDLVSLRVAVDQPAYVYVVGRESSGAPSILFPISGALRMSSGEVRTLPSDGNAIELDQKAGEEALYVVASSQPLPRDTPEALQRLLTDSIERAQRPTALAETPAPPPPAPSGPEPSRPPPMPVPTNDRGLKLICTQTAGAVCARSIRTGLAVAKLSFSHTSARKPGPLPSNAR